MELIQQLISDAVRANIEKREEIVCSIIKQCLGVDIDLEQERKRIFKRVAFVNHEGGTTWYYNDGSEEGLRIVTFKAAIPSLDADSLTGMLFTTEYEQHLKSENMDIQNMVINRGTQSFTSQDCEIVYWKFAGAAGYKIVNTRTGLEVEMNAGHVEKSVMEKIKNLSAVTGMNIVEAIHKNEDA